MIQASGHPDIPIYLTEFNWPLKGSGKHSPAGEHVQTDEVDQARFLVLYDLTAAATGQVASTFWWQLVARGYGLLDEAPRDGQIGDGGLGRTNGFLDPPVPQAVVPHAMNADASSASSSEPHPACSAAWRS